jgi:putative intracellular protease/amidase
MLSKWQHIVMTTKRIHLAVYDTLADWEIGYLTAEIRNGRWQREPGSCSVVTVGKTLEPVVTMGGLRITPEIVLDELASRDSAMLVLAGADLWDSSEDLEPFARAAREFLDAGVPVAAICGATAGLAREGLLNERRHTSAVREYLEMQPGYTGGEHYADVDACTDGDLITAGPTEPIAFAREVFARLETFRPDVLQAWFRLFKHSDPSAYELLATA